MSLNLEEYLTNELARQIERAAADLRDAAESLDSLARQVRSSATGQYAFYATQTVQKVTTTLANLPLSNVVQTAAEAAVARAEAAALTEEES